MQRRPDRRRHVGALARDAPRAAQRVVLGRRAGRRRRDRRPRLPLHRDRPQLHGQGEPARRGHVLARHARAPDRGGGQRDRADPVRVRARSASSRSRGRSAAGWISATRWPAPRGRSGRTTSCAPGSRCSPPARAAATSPRRPRRRAAGCSPSATRCPSSATSTCSRTCSTRWTRAAQPMETFYDGYVVNAVMDACYRSAESRALGAGRARDWRGGDDRADRARRAASRTARR